MERKNMDTKSIENEILNLKLDEDISQEKFEEYIDYLIEKETKRKHL